MFAFRRDPARTAAPRPHVVVLVWDTTRADRLSPYGYTRDTTPWLTGVAKEGVLFEQCRAPSPWTLPSHASMMTGLLPRDHGAVELQSMLAPARVTLAERLSAEGYDTILVAANALVGRRTGLAQGFDVAVAASEDPRTPKASTVISLLETELETRANDPARAARPLFLFLNFMEPHLPYAPPLELERPWRPDGVSDEEVARAKRFEFPREMHHNLGLSRVSDRALSILSSLYDAELRDLDRRCADLEAVLRKHGLLATADAAAGTGGTLLVVTSDHGENLGEEGLLDHKLSLSDALLHVPMVLRWPGRIPPGRRVTEAVRLQDLYPTVLEAAGATAGAPPTPDAVSLLVEPLAARALVAEFPAPLSFLAGMRRELPGEPEERFELLRRGILAVVDTSLRKVIVTHRVAPDGARTEISRRLHDLRTDPGEKRDLLADADAALLAEAERLLDLAKPAAPGK